MKEIKRILMVDESRVIHTYMNGLLRVFGYELVSAFSLSQVKEFCDGEKGFFVSIISMDILDEADEIVTYVTRKGIPTVLLRGVEEESLRERLIKKNHIISTVDKRHKEDFQAIVELIRKIDANTNISVLVVDDSKTFRYYVRDLLRDHHFRILEAENGVEALEIIKQHPELKLVITDYEMPQMNGLELIKGVRERISGEILPMVVMSSLEAKQVIVECLRHGANDYLHKPFEREEFFGRIYHILSLKEKVDEIRKQTDLLKHYKETIDKNTIVSMTDEQGFITYFSEAFEKLSGYTQKEVVGRRHGIFRHPDTTKEFYREMWEKLSLGNTWSGEIRNCRKDGSSYWLKLTITPEWDENGRVIGYSSIGHDITDKINLETLTRELEYRVASEIEKNRMQTAQMVEQSRLAQMGEMISMIAHQWRQPLASISAIASTLNLDVMMDNYQQEFFEERLESINELSQHLSSTIDDFRGFFKAEKEKQTILPREVVEGCLNIIGTALDSTGIRLIKHYDDSRKIHSYFNELKQVVLNILKNAEDALKESADKEKIIEIYCYEEGSLSCIKICDTAGGVPDAIKEKIFDPYFSTKTQKDGTGLGLYMSKTIIEDHCKGSLKLDNSDKGACFIIELPLSDMVMDKFSQSVVHDHSSISEKGESDV